VKSDGAGKDWGQSIDDDVLNKESFKPLAQKQAGMDDVSFIAVRYKTPETVSHPPAPPISPPSITTGAPPDAQQFESSKARLEVKSDRPPYNLPMERGDLPDGKKLSISVRPLKLKPPRQPDVKPEPSRLSHERKVFITGIIIGIIAGFILGAIYTTLLFRLSVVSRVD
jgi:hypothetical protein